MVRQSGARPTGTERTFGPDEIIVSKTDPRGVITYVNEVFLRVSAYDEAEILGQPHNVIRHPDMPRAVFRLLWDTIADGREIFAYVLNLAGDGAHYWVLAHVTPTRGANGQIIGFHSNRRTASPAALRLVEPLYKSLLDAERRHSGAREAVDASTALLTSVLAEKGITYDEFVWSLDTETAIPSLSARGAA